MPNEVRFTSDPDEHESAEYVVCVLAGDGPPVLPDNVFDFCCRCGRKVQHRPHVPVAPKRVCYECIKPDIERDPAKGELETIVTHKTRQELLDYLARTKAQ